MKNRKDRDWSEARSGCEEIYYHICHVCGNSFYGFKSRIFCKKCHETHKPFEG